MAKSVNALGQIQAVKKEIARKEKAYEDNRQYEELVEQKAEEVMPRPVERVAPKEEQSKYQAVSEPPKKSMSDLFDKRSNEKSSVTFLVQRDVLKEVDRICKTYNISRTEFFNKALDEFMKTYDH